MLVYVKKDGFGNFQSLFIIFISFFPLRICYFKGNQNCENGVLACKNELSACKMGYRSSLTIGIPY